MLTVGEIVRGSYWPETVEIKKCEQLHDYYIVEALGRKSHTYYQMILEDKQLGTIDRLSLKQHSETYVKNAEDLQHYIQYYALKIDQKYSLTRSLGGNEVIPLPHQIDAVYRQMLQSPQIRYLLADDPGAGKTIMSGMVIRELRARKSADRILILTPPLVLTQWQSELKDKFHEEFTIMNRSSLDNVNGQNPFEHHSSCLASLHWAARDDIKDLLINANFDLVIIDEAHKMAAYTHGKKERTVQRTRLFRLGEALVRNAPHCLLLTATPHKGNMENYRHLLSLLDKDVFSHLHRDETLREKSNPYVIRRLKESMVNFDESPIFPKRTTRTIEFELTEHELSLYQAVTEYVQDHFNRASLTGNNSITFAMMVLQRRLSSSLESVHLSLKRRKERLFKLYHETIVGEDRLSNQRMEVSHDEWDEMNADEQRIVEEEVEGVVETVNTNELMKEIQELDHLIDTSTKARMHGTERKYVELEETLFGADGLINQGEKVIIFTEFKDTLNHLYRSLITKVSEIAIISGDYSIERRRQQVDLFRNECQIMLATDAGGESINLQFCNQMINYDIPWNPNRLEQRMGRIHRIGQKNDVVVFNLVARNTREGDVLIRLLTKMDQMREDLGYEGVYDFIGEVLEDRGTNLSTLMQEAITNRETIDHTLKGVESSITEEHKKLIKTMQSEQLDETGFDLSSLRKQRTDITVNSLPYRAYTKFLVKELAEKNVSVYQSTGDDLFRIDRLPKSIREFAIKHEVTLKTTEGSYRFTSNKENQSHEVDLIQNDHPLFNLALKFKDEEIQSIVTDDFQISYPVDEQLAVDIFEVEFGDGMGTELFRAIIYLAKRRNGEHIQLDPYWIFSHSFSGEIHPLKHTDNSRSLAEALGFANSKLTEMHQKRESTLIKKQQFLRRVFEAQYESVLNRLSTYRTDNLDNRNRALINQMKSQLDDIQERREERLEEVSRERSMFMKPLKHIIQVELIPDGQAYRVIPEDWMETVTSNEKNAGRTNINHLHSYGLIDFHSEDYEGQSRFIILIKDQADKLTQQHMKDLKEIEEFVFIYVLKGDQIVEEVRLIEVY